MEQTTVESELELELERLVARSVEDTVREHTQKTGGSVYPWTQACVDEFAPLLKTADGIEKLITDPYFLGLGAYIYPSIMNDIIDLFEERRERPINLVIFLEGIGSGKTTKFSILQFLQWFELSCHLDPQAHFNLIPGSVIALINLSRTEAQARRIAFGEVWRRFQCPFVRDYFTPNPRFTKEIQIPQNNTVIFAGTSSAMSALGYNLYGGGIDEACFLEIVEDSKRAADQEKYDAAEEIHNAIWDRMTSRFMVDGEVPGFLVMFSSPRYPDDFLERKIAQAIELGKDSGIFWRRRSTWGGKDREFCPSDRHFYVDTDSLEEVTEDEAIDGGNLTFLDSAEIPLRFTQSIIDGDLVCTVSDHGINLTRGSASVAPSSSSDLDSFTSKLRALAKKKKESADLASFSARLRALKKIGKDSTEVTDAH